MKKAAFKRAQIAHVLKVITGTLALFSGLFFACALDTEGEAYKYIILGMVVSFTLAAITMLLERYVISTINKYNLNVDYRPIFYWNDCSHDYDYEEDDEDEDEAYYGWLNHERLDDTDDNYDFYQKYIA